MLFLKPSIGQHLYKKNFENFGICSNFPRTMPILQIGELNIPISWLIQAYFIRLEFTKTLLYSPERVLMVSLNFSDWICSWRFSWRMFSTVRRLKSSGISLRNMLNAYLRSWNVQQSFGSWSFSPAKQALAQNIRCFRGLFGSWCGGVCSKNYERGLSLRYLTNWSMFLNLHAGMRMETWLIWVCEKVS